MSVAEAQALTKRFPPYPDYRDSRINGLGALPGHWAVRRLKRISSLRFSNVDKKIAEDEHPVRLCNYVDVYYNDYITSELNFMEATASRDEMRRFALRKGDVLITKDSEAWDDIAVPAYVDVDLDGVLCGYHLAQIRPNRGRVAGGYLFRAFSAQGVLDQFRVAASGITRFGLSKDSIGSAFFPVPPPDEQHLIASFLRRETAKIDALVAKKWRLVELLEEKRTALISHAVTKGLDPDVPMKDPGIDWLGHVPKHWEATRLKHVVPNITVGIVITPAKYYVDAGVPCLRSLNVSGHTVSFDDLVFISPDSNELHGKSKIYEGDIVIVRTGKAGAAAVVPAELSGANSIDLVIVRKSPNALSKFLHYFINSRPAIRQVEAFSVGSIQAHYNTTSVGELWVPVPPLGEQQNLVEWLDEEAGKIDSLTRRIRDGIGRLCEYRTALISAAVTGKIDVRNVTLAASKPPLPENTAFKVGIG